jgi:hypothetical protein
VKDFDADIDAALASEAQIPRQLVVSWIENASNLRTLSKLYRLTDVGYYRIQPELGGEVTCALIQRYLLQCIRENVEDDGEIESRFEAAMSFQGWFLRLLELKRDAVLRQAADAITDLYLSDESIQYTIETAFLEHALETNGLRPYFEHWSRDERLRDGWHRAMEWAKDHPDYMANMYQRLRDRKS